MPPPPIYYRPAEGVCGEKVFPEDALADAPRAPDDEDFSFLQAVLHGPHKIFLQIGALKGLLAFIEDGLELGELGRRDLGVRGVEEVSVEAPLESAGVSFKPRRDGQAARRDGEDLGERQRSADSRQQGFRTLAKERKINVWVS